MATISCEVDSRDGGGIPPGPPPVRGLSKTESFRRFQRAIGDATLHLNTVAVGLQAISSDPTVAQRAAAELNVGWRPPAAPKGPAIVEPLAKRMVMPSDPGRLRNLTSRSKIFVLRAVLVAACDSLDTYVGEVTMASWLKFNTATAEICNKAVTKPGKIAWSLAERYSTLCTALGLTGFEGHCALVALGSRWRNALVHAEDAEFKLDKNDKSALILHAHKLNKAGFVATQALERFESEMNPTLKDITTIISYAQELCKAIDRQAIARVASQESEIEDLLRQRLKKHFKSPGRIEDFWGIHRLQEWDEKGRKKNRTQDLTERTSDFDAKWKSRFGSLLDALGFSATKDSASAPLSAREIGRLSSMSARMFADELGIT